MKRQSQESDIQIDEIGYVGFGATALGAETLFFLNNPNIIDGVVGVGAAALMAYGVRLHTQRST